MSFEEKGTWISLALAIVIPAIYFTHVLGQVGQTPVAEIAYARPLVTAIIAAIVAAIVAHIVVAMAKPSEADQKDERDKRINRFGEYVGGIVLGVAVAGVLVLTLLEVEHFWIANAIYAAFILSAVTSSTVKLVAYRRGLSPG
jgi:uncharacterized membrane protein